MPCSARLGLRAIVGKEPGKRSTRTGGPTSEEPGESMNIVVSNVKGGVGKTTTSVYLSAAAVERGWDPVLLIDADRQASSAEWMEESPVEGVGLVEAPSERTVTRAMSGHAGFAVIDTPPGDERIVRAALDRADAVVIPTRAGGVRVFTGGGHPRHDRGQDALWGGHLLGATRHQRPRRGHRLVDRVEGAHLGDRPRTGRHRRRARSPALPRRPRGLHRHPQEGGAQTADLMLSCRGRPGWRAHRRRAP